MHKTRQNIVILRAQHKLYSSLSVLSSQNMIRELSDKSTTVRVVNLSSPADLAPILRSPPNIVIVGAKYISSTNNSLIDTNNNRFWLADALQKNNIAHTGSPSIAHARECDKPTAKAVVRQAGIKTAEWQVYEQSEWATASSTLPYPLFLKPVGRGGGLGIDDKSVVHNQTQLRAKIQSIGRNHKSDTLAETLLTGREFSVALLANVSDDHLTAMPIELTAPQDSKGFRMLSGSVKMADAEQVQIVSDLTLNAAICNLALRAFKALGARGYGRIDIRLDEYGTPHFLEANLVPSLVENYGSFPKACLLNMGIGYGQMLRQIIGARPLTSKQTSQLFALPTAKSIQLSA